MEENTKTYIVDSSVIMAILMPDEKILPETQKFIKILESKSKFIAPNLLEFEIGNSLKSSFFSKRITQKEADSLFTIFGNLPITFQSIKRDLVLKLSLKHKLSFYDASYLCLAKTNKCKLLTLDKKLMTLSK